MIEPENEETENKSQDESEEAEYWIDKYELE